MKNREMDGKAFGKLEAYILVSSNDQRGSHFSSLWSEKPPRFSMHLFSCGFFDPENFFPKPPLVPGKPSLF